MYLLLCQRRPEFFDLWEANRGPFQDLGPPVPPLTPCRHRELEPFDSVACELCGQWQVQVPVFACNIFGECTLRRYGNSTKRARDMLSCLTCDHYEPYSEVLDQGRSNSVRELTVCNKNREGKTRTE